MFDTSLGVPVDDPIEINIQKCQLCVGRRRNEIGAMKHQSRIHRKHVLSPVVIEVSKSLNWEVAEHIKFSKTMKKYGFSRSIDALRIIVNVFALAGMHMEVHPSLRDIVCYYNEVNLDAFELFPILLESSKDAAGPTSVNGTSSQIQIDAVNQLPKLESSSSWLYPEVGQIKKKPNPFAASTYSSSQTQMGTANHSTGLEQSTTLQFLGPTQRQKRCQLLQMVLIILKLSWITWMQRISFSDGQHGDLLLLLVSAFRKRTPIGSLICGQHTNLSFTSTSGKRLHQLNTRIVLCNDRVFYTTLAFLV